MKRKPVRARGERNRPVCVGPRIHATLKRRALASGMKLGALAERLIEAGLRSEEAAR